MSDAEEKLMRLLLSESDKVIGKLEAEIKLKIEEDRQNNSENTEMAKSQRNGKIWKKKIYCG